MSELLSPVFNQRLLNLPLHMCARFLLVAPFLLVLSIVFPTGFSGTVSGARADIVARAKIPLEKLFDNAPRQSRLPFQEKRPGQQIKSAPPTQLAQSLWGDSFLFAYPRFRPKPRSNAGDRQFDSLKPLRRKRVSRTYQTMCVRLCDGYYWPMSFSTTRGNFRKDERKCENSCSAPVKLYHFKNPGDQVNEMKDRKGAAYAKIANAFRYRREYVASCKCRPDPWSKVSLSRHKEFAMKAKRIRRVRSVASYKRGLRKRRSRARWRRTGRVRNTSLRARRSFRRRR